MLGLKIFKSQRIGSSICIKPLSLVRDTKGDSLSGLASAPNLNQLVGCHPIAVDDCIVQSFPERQFNVGFVASNAARLLDQLHQQIHQRRDSFDPARHPNLDLKQGPSGASHDKVPHAVGKMHRGDQTSAYFKGTPTH